MGIRDAAIDAREKIGGDMAVFHDDESVEVRTSDVLSEDANARVRVLTADVEDAMDVKMSAANAGKTKMGAATMFARLFGTDGERGSKRVQKAASLGLAAVVAVSLQVAPARADLTSDLLAKTEANKELNDKKRAATSSANFERSRTVTDGFCNFPQNIFGCENAAEKGDVKFLSDDLKVECEGTDAGKICASKNSGSYPSFLGL